MPNPGIGPNIALYGDDNLELLQEFSDIERRYRSLIDLKIRQDKYLNKKLEILRRNWCSPYDRVSQICFQTGTWLLLICACILIMCRWLPRTVVPTDYRPDFSVMVWAFMSLSAESVFGLILLEILLNYKHKAESTIRRRK